MVPPRSSGQMMTVELAAREALNKIEIAIEKIHFGQRRYVHPADLLEHSASWFAMKVGYGIEQEDYA